jgi:hypothetical protein
MPTVFENLSDGFYTAFFEPDSEKRRTSIESWIMSAVPVLQAAVENDIRQYLEWLLRDTWSPEGWKSRATKFAGEYQNNKKKNLFMDTYKLYLDVSLRPHDEKYKDVIIGALTSEVRANTLIMAKNVILGDVSKLKKNETVQISSIVEEDNYDDDSNDDHSSNDDRSDSMNPNNDSYQSAMDNHSDQMNSNNDAYWSSRGR